MLKYKILMESLRNRLSTINRFNGRLPSLMELAKQENCSLNTVQRAVQELKKEGVLLTKTGQGTFSLASYPFEDLEKSIKLPVRFINCCGFSMSNMLMLKDFYASLDEVMFKDERSIHNYSLQKKNGVILPLAERDLATSVCGNFLFSPFNEELLSNLVLQCKNIVSIDRDLTVMGIDSVVNDNMVGAMLVTNKLIEMGHKKIAYIGTHQTIPEANGFDPALSERFHGFKSAFLLKNLPLDEDLCVSVENRSPDSAVKALDKLFAKGKSFTAIVSFFNSPNEFAEYLRGKKLSTPKDISIASAGKTVDSSLMGGAVFSMKNAGQIAWDLMKRRIDKTNKGASHSSERAELCSIAPIFELGETIAKPPR